MDLIYITGGQESFKCRYQLEKVFLTEKNDIPQKVFLERELSELTIIIIMKTRHRVLKRQGVIKKVCYLHTTIHTGVYESSVAVINRNFGIGLRKVLQKEEHQQSVVQGTYAILLQLLGFN